MRKEIKIELSNDEELLHTLEFASNPILFWFKDYFALTSKRIVGSKKSRILGLIPFGKAELTFPLKNISGIRVTSRFRVMPFLFGSLITLIGLIFTLSKLPSLFDGELSGFLFSLFLFAFGTHIFTKSYTHSIEITNNAGQKPVLKISTWKKSKIQNFVDQINSSIAGV